MGAMQLPTANAGDRISRANSQFGDRHFQALINHIADVILVINRERTVLYVSPSVEHVLGYRPEELIGADAFSLVHPDDVPELQAIHAETVRADGATRARMHRLRAKDGSWRYFESTGKNLTDHESIQGILITSRDITPRQRVQRALEESEVKYRQLVEQSTDGIFVANREGHLEFANSHGCALLGCAPDEVTRISILDTYAPEDVAAARQRMLDLPVGQILRFERRLVRRDGTSLPVEVALRKLEDGRFQGIVHDISSRQRAETDLRYRLAFEELIATISAAFIKPDARKIDDEIDRALQAVGTFVGVDRCYLFQFDNDQHITDNTHEWCAPGVTAHKHRLQAMPVDSLPWIFQRLQRGETVAVTRVSDLPEEAAAERREFELEEIQSLICVPMIVGTTVVGFVGLDAVRAARDWPADVVQLLKITGEMFVNALLRQRTENALHASNQELQRVLAELRTTQQQIVQQERLRALGTMASGIAHDFNNALAAILGFNELLLHRPELLDDRAKTLRYLQMMNTAAQDAGNVVSRLREFYRHREDRDVFAPLNVNRLVNDAISLTRPKWKDQAQANATTIRIETDLGDVPTVAGNAADLREVLTNLILNAVDAMPDGGTITVRTRLDGDHVALAISDTGLGMTEDVRRRCLEPFFTTKGDRGTGLGLSMVHGIIRRHEGRIEIETAVGKGTTFVIHLPTAPLTKPGTETAEPACPTRQLHVLVVDDESDVREIVTETLRGEGHIVEPAANGREALDQFATSHFDAVVLDRAMPDISGDQIATLVKAVAPTIPVIMLTGFGSMMKAAGEVPTGVDSIISKPVTIDELSRTLAALTAPAA
jgi:PAS domain S-box-containing protein